MHFMVYAGNRIFTAYVGSAGFIRESRSVQIKRLTDVLQNILTAKLCQ